MLADPLPLALLLALPLELPLPLMPDDPDGLEPVVPDALPDDADFICTWPLAVLQCVVGEMFWSLEALGELGDELPLPD